MIKVIELFAGVGGFRIGLENASKDFKIVWSNQYEPSTKKQHASEIYINKFGLENHSNVDINLVETKDIPNADLLVGGFPCQDYSVASVNSKGIVGKKGVLWWQIYRILKEKEELSPKYLILENVDRLLISPSKQKGRDFAIILSSLNQLGYFVEWGVIDASAYGMPQKRKRLFIVAIKQDFTNILNNNILIQEYLEKKSIISESFPINKIELNEIKTGIIEENILNVSNEFNIENKKNIFLNRGICFNNRYFTIKSKANYNGEFKVLNDIIEKEDSNISSEFFINDKDLDKWKYLKGFKKFERTNKDGFKYNYTEGSMSFPDSLDKPARTIITTEGGKVPSRFKHIIYSNNKYRRLTPIELERANMFPDNHTQLNGVSDTKRAFLMGNALVVGIVEKLGKTILKNFNL